MERKWIITGLVLLITGIILGAFGAHALKDIIHDQERLASFETGVRYQLIHGVAFLSLPFIAKQFQLDTKWVYRLLLIGVLFFSVSIYGLTMRDVWSLGGLAKVFGPITPVGGLLLIIGWGILLVQVIRKR
ncbi:MAG: DUF423 domain-containing protein [Flavobacteriia bacterium]|nr:DUF423 domain-containing protein [Flavobacteriia bacterium]